MTVIVYDGSTLAVDRSMIKGDVLHSATKCQVIGHTVLTGHGMGTQVAALYHWYKTGAQPDKFPISVRTNPLAELIVVTKDGLLRYEGSPHPIEHGKSKCAFGEGSPFAYGALAMGATAKDAVDVAIQFSPYCGGGIDVFSWSDDRLVASLNNNPSASAVLRGQPTINGEASG